MHHTKHGQVQADKYRVCQSRTGYFELRWTEQGPDGRPRTRTLSTRTTDAGEAERFKEQFVRAELEAETLATRWTIAKLAEFYEKRLTADDAGETQLYSLKPIKDFFGHLVPAQIDANTVLDYRLKRAKLGRADGTIRRELGALVAVLNFGVQNKKFPLAELPTVAMPPQSEPRDVWMNEQDEAEFFALAMADSDGKPRLTRISRFIAIGLNTAARKEAIFGLTWDRVQFAGRIIDFREPGRRITKKRRVPIPISDRLLPILLRAWEERVSDYVLDHPGDIRTAFDTFKDKCPDKFNAVTPHVMRHTWATLAARAGVSLFEIAGVLGDTIETVTRNYAHHCPEHLRAAVNARHKAS